MIYSILKQDFRNFELIVIDDGSTDDTVGMLETNYNDIRMRIIRKENNGVSSARNMGISLARGKYITFVDSDDYLLNGFFKDIYNVLSKKEEDVLVYGGYVTDNLGESLRAVPLFRYDYDYGNGDVVIKNGKDFLKDFCLLNGNSWGCAKVFKKKMIKKNKIYFDEKICYGEDMLFNIQVYFVASKVIASPKKFYVNNIMGESLSRGGISSIDKLKNLVEIYGRIEEYEEFRHLLALNSIRHMRMWILFGIFKLDENTKIRIQKIYQDLPDNLCKNNEKIEKIVSQYSLWYAIFIYCLYVVVYRYILIFFIIPLISLLVCKIKK